MGNVQFELLTEAEEEDVLVTAVAAVADMDGADVGVFFGWSHRDPEENHDLLSGEWVPE